MLAFTVFAFKRGVWFFIYSDSGVFKGGGLCEAPPPWPDRRDFCNYFGIILAPFRDKIAATSDQMRFWAGKCFKMRLRPGLRPGPRWGSLQRSPSAANLACQPDLRGPTSKGVEGRPGREVGRGQGRGGREQRGREREGWVGAPPLCEILNTPLYSGAGYI